MLMLMLVLVLVLVFVYVFVFVFVFVLYAASARTRCPQFSSAPDCDPRLVPLVRTSQSWQHGRATRTSTCTRARRRRFDRVRIEEWVTGATRWRAHSGHHGGLDSWAFLIEGAERSSRAAS